MTARATITDTVVAYNPPEPLSGRVVVQVLLRDRAGNQTNSAWDFTIAAVHGAVIRSVTVHPTTPLQAGQVLTVTMVGEPGGQASFAIEGVADGIPMAEATNQPGVYFGSYIPGAQLTISAVAIDPAGRRSAPATVRVTQS